MPRKPNLEPLPEAERRQKLAAFLAVVERHPDLAPLRALLRTGPQRQLALIAALEREVILGSPTACPPSPDDPSDLVLCDILDCLDQDPELKNHGAAYGPDRRLANLQALGLWRGSEPVSRPTARELLTTSFSRLTADPVSDLPSPTPNNSPLPQVFGSGGELIGPQAPAASAQEDVSAALQTATPALLGTNDSGALATIESAAQRGIIHHQDDPPGEQIEEAELTTRQIPARAVRRGRPLALDDLAKGRLLGLMSYGLSCRQAAAQLGVHHVTILNLMKRDEEFAQQVSEARLDASSQPLLTVIQASRKNWRAAAWLAKFLEERRGRRLETTPEERELESRGR